MTTFETSAELGIQIPDRELRSARKQVEDSIGSVSVNVDGGRPAAPDGGTNTMALASGGVANELSEQTSVLEEIHDELEKIGVSGAGGGSGSGLLGGLSGFGLGSAVAGGGALGTILGAGGKIKNTLGRAGRVMRGGRGLAGMIGRSPWTMLSQTAGMRDVSNLGSQEQGPVMSFLAQNGPSPQEMTSIFPEVQPPGPEIWPEIEPPSPETIWPDVTGSSDGREEQQYRQNNPGLFDDEEWPANPGRGMAEYQDTTNYAAGYQSGHSQMAFTPAGPGSSSAAPGMGSGHQRVGGTNQASSSNRARDRRSGETSVEVGEVTANIDGRSLEDALERSLQGMKSELRDAVLAEIDNGMAPR